MMNAKTEYFIAGRQAGKTTYMLSRIGELQDEHGEVTIICFDQNEADRIAGIIADCYWDLEIDPSRVRTLSANSLASGALRGRTGCLVVDNFDLADPRQTAELWHAIQPVALVTENH